MEGIKKFDAYTKINEDFRIRYWIGGIISILMIITMIWMFSSEFNDYFKTNMRPVLQIDESKTDKLPINFDITFHESPCQFTTIDVLDTMGEVNLDIDQNIKKIRINPVEDSEQRKKKFGKQIYGNECPSCAQGDSKKCCYTCNEIKESYEKMKIEMPRNVQQCKKDNIQKMNEYYKGEGCRMIGSVKVNKVSGNFHIAPGISEQSGDRHFHSSNYQGSVNMSHTWNYLMFGEGFPGMQNPIENLTKIDESNDSMYQYFVQIVPTTFIGLNEKEIKTNGYSVTEHYRAGNVKREEKGVPGVFVLYEISSMEVLYYEERNSVGHLLTGICGIVGGMFTVFSLIDRFIYYLIGNKLDTKEHVM